MNKTKPRERLLLAPTVKCQAERGRVWGKSVGFFFPLKPHHSKSSVKPNEHRQSGGSYPFIPKWPCPPPPAPLSRGTDEDCSRGREQVGRRGGSIDCAAKALGSVRTAGENLNWIPVSVFGINSLRVASIKPWKEIIRWVFSPHSYPLQSEKSERGHQPARRLLINSSSLRHGKASSCKEPSYLGTGTW